MELMGLVRTLAESMQFQRNLDVTLKSAIHEVIQDLKADKISMCVGLDAHSLGLVSNKHSSTELVLDFGDFFDPNEPLTPGTWYFKSLPEYSDQPCCLCCIIKYTHVDEHGRTIAPSRTEYIAFCLLYTSPSPRDKRQSRMPSSA